jgi:predicted dehydrogenase
MEVTTAMIEATARRLRLAFIGGGGASMIGPVHRRAALLDERFEIVAGALSSNAERSHAEGLRLGLTRDRCYRSAHEMLDAERPRADGIEAVAIVTPNDSHHPLVMAALGAGLDVICDKPLANTLDDALAIANAADAARRIVCLTHAYSGYPMIRQARAMVAAGEIGEVRSVQIEYYGGGLAARIEDLPDAHKRWRLDPARSGPSLVLADIGTHAHHLAGFVAGKSPVELSADVATLMPGRRAHDYASIRLRWSAGTRGTIVLNQAATGHENHLALRIVGSRASLTWCHRDHNELRVLPLDGPASILSRGQPGLSSLAKHATRIPRTGHPEGLHEAFANLYRETAEAIVARNQGWQSGGDAAVFPTAWDGVSGLRFVEAALRSSAADGQWVACS